MRGNHDDLINFGAPDVVSGQISGRGVLELPFYRGVTEGGSPLTYNTWLFLDVYRNPELPYRDPKVDVNATMNPKKYFLGRYSICSGNWVAKSDFINLRTTFINFNKAFADAGLNISGFASAGGRNFPWWYNRLIAEYGTQGWYEYTYTQSNGLLVYVQSLVINFRYDLNPGVTLQYGWF